MEEKEVENVLKKIGRGNQEQSTLFDEFERLSFEIQLNQAILRRSLSSPVTGLAVHATAPPPPEVAIVSRGGWKKAATTPFRKAMTKLLRPFLVSKRKEMRNVMDATSIDGYCSKRFSRSIRV